MTHMLISIIIIALALAFAASWNAETASALRSHLAEMLSADVSRIMPAHTPTPTPTATATPASEQTSGRVYLDKVIPPCTLITVLGKDPCKPRPDIPNDIMDGGPVLLLMWRHYSEYLGKTLEGFGSRSSAGRSDIAHIALRATGIPNTARCTSQIPMVGHGYSTDTRRHSDFLGHSTLCFIDVKVQEYIAGKGAPTVTLQVSHAPWNFKGVRWDDVSTWDDFVKRQIEQRYAGSEHLFYIQPSIFTGAEVWEARADFDIVRNEPPFDYWHDSSDNECDTDLCAHERLLSSIYKYPEIISETRKLHKELVKKHGGRITAEPGVADLVLDTYELTSFFTQVGAYENTSVTPAPPPPVPGENDPYTPGTRVDDPPAGDDATVTVPGGLDDTATDTPTPTPTATTPPAPLPTDTPTPIPTQAPLPTDTPTTVPTDTSTAVPTAIPTQAPMPTDTPTTVPTDTSTAVPTQTPMPTDMPTAVPAIALIATADMQSYSCFYPYAGSCKGCYSVPNCDYQQ